MTPLPGIQRGGATLGALLVLAAACVSATSAQAHNQGADSVDRTVFTDPEIRWEDHTRFDAERRFAIAQWNRLGKVDIVPDNAITVTDLEFVDFRRCDVTWDAFWSRRLGSDVVGFNPCNVRRDSVHRADPKAVAVHEVGHALRLAHPSGERYSRYWRDRSIMFFCARCTPTSTYRAHDTRDYRRTW